MPGRDEDLGGVLDLDRMVQRRVKDEERHFQPPNRILKAVRTRILDKLPSDKERAPARRGGYGAHFRNVPVTARTAAPPSEWPISTAGCLIMVA